MGNILVEKIFNQADWNGELDKRLSYVNEAYNKFVKKRKISVEDFYEAVLTRDFFVASLILFRKKNDLDIAQYEEYKNAFLQHCKRKIEQEYHNYAESGQKEFFRNQANALATSLLYEQGKLTEKIISSVYRCINDKYEIFLFFQQVFQYIYQVKELGKTFVLLLNVMYKIFDIDVNERVLRKFEIQLEMDDDYCEDVRKLIAVALRRRQIGYINILLRIFREIPLNDLDINIDMLVKSIKKGPADEFLDGIFLLKRVLVSRMQEHEAGMCEWWQIINRKIAPKNIMWYPYEGYLQVYYISKLIQNNPKEIEKYVQFIPRASRTTVLKEEYNTIIQETVELLFEYGYEYLEKYLVFLGENNAFQYDKDVISKPFYVERSYYFIEEKIEKYIATGVSLQELVDSYMNTHLRVSYPLFLFCDILVAYFEEMIHANAADLLQIFQKYEISAKWVESQGQVRFELLNIFNGNELLGYSYLNQEFVEYILDDKEVSSVYCLLDRYMLDTGEICITLDLQQEGLDLLLGGFIELCDRIAENGYLEETDREKLMHFSIPSDELDEDQRVDLSICILDTCLELCIHSEDTMDFLDILQAMYGRKDPFLFLGYNDSERCYQEMFSEDEKQDILHVWECLKECDISVSEAVSIYMHTVLRFFVPISSVLYFFDSESERYALNEILGRYTFTGKVLKVPCNENGLVAYISQQDFLLNSEDNLLYVGTDRAVFRRENIKKNVECVFRLAYYNRMRNNLYVYAVKEKKQNAAKENKDAYKELLYKLLLMKKPDIGHFNQLKYADVSFEVADKLEIENIQIAFLERYAEDVTSINRFLMAIWKDNFCVYSQANLRRMGIVAREINSEKTMNVLRKILQNNSEEVLLKVYFNTALKYYADLNALLELVSEIGNMDLLLKYMSNYPLRVFTTEQGLEAINFVGYDMELQIEEPEPEEEISEEEDYTEDYYEEEYFEEDDETEEIEEAVFERTELQCLPVTYQKETGIILLREIPEVTEEVV